MEQYSLGVFIHMHVCICDEMMLSVCIYLFPSHGHCVLSHDTYDIKKISSEGGKEKGMEKAGER